MGNFKWGLFTGLCMTAFAFGCGDDIDGVVDQTPSGGETGNETGGETGGETGDMDPVEPLDLSELVAGEWTFIENENMVCMDGSTSGFGVRLKEGATKLLIHLQDGGACFNTATCGQVFNQNGFLEPEMTMWANTFGGGGIFDDASGPFAEYSMVFVPYCGGDVHGGNTTDGFGDRMHLGRGNVTAVLDAVEPAFGAISDKVILSGSSAGALGVLLNYEQTAETFEGTPVDLLSDSGPVLDDMILAPCLQQEVRDIWNLNPSLPADCQNCTNADGGGLTNIYEYLATTYPERNFSLLTTTNDNVFTAFYAFGGNNCSIDFGINLSPGVFRWAARMQAFENMNIYVLNGSSHVLTNNRLNSISEGITLSDWLVDFETESAVWEDVVPAAP